MAKRNVTLEPIPYYPGTFDSKIAKDIRNAVLSSSITFVEIEGSIRAGKDVLTLNAYAEFLMLTPDTKHLVTHVTTNAAKETVLDANGFGVKFLIPHGKEIVEDNRVVYHFKDWNGIDKEIHFYGLSQYNDHEKFRGISFGSHYANESTKQNIVGLKAARDRTTAAKWRKIIYTQNPISPSNEFYKDMETQLMATPAQVSEIHSLRDKFKDEYEDAKFKFDKYEKQSSKKIVMDFLFEKKKSSVEFLSANEKLALRKLLLSNKYECRQKREEYLYDNYGITSKHFVFFEGGENPNNVKNGLDFRYFHLTLDDNPSISNVRREEVKASYDPNSLHYKRDILGIRALTDGAIYDNLTNDNFYYQDLPNLGLMQQGWRRILSVDYGVKNDFVILDSFIEPKTKTIYIERELRFKGNDESERRSATNELYTDLTKQFISEREGGKYTQLLYDPSARAFANSLASHNIKCQRANNVVKRSQRVKKLDNENQDKRIYKENMGIGLVKDGFGLNKIKINKKNCPDLVNEIEGYSFDPKKLLVGIEEPLKINDHGADALRYIVNTEIKTIKVWLNSKNEEVNLDDVRTKAKDTEELQQNLCERPQEFASYGRKSFSNF